MSANYTQQKLWQAVQCLIWPLARIQERLNSAAVLLGPARPPHGVRGRSGHANPI